MRLGSASSESGSEDDSIIPLIRISYLPVYAIHEFSLDLKDFGLNDEIRTMFINVRQKTEKARNSMAQRYNSQALVHTFNIGDLVSLHIDAKYRKSTTPAKLFCKVIRKPLPDMHELQCVHRVLSSKYRTTDLERFPATINLQIGNNTTRITLTKAVALIHEANPTAV